jgi:hypothetical protein
MEVDADFLEVDQLAQKLLMVADIDGLGYS